jgi:hypothetical protein
MQVLWCVMERWGFAAHCACEARFDYARDNQENIINDKFSDTLMCLKLDDVELQQKIKKNDSVQSTAQLLTQRRRRVASAARPASAATPVAGTGVKTAKVDVSFSETVPLPDVMPLMCTTKSQSFTPLNTAVLDTAARAAEVPLTENTQVPDCPLDQSGCASASVETAGGS